MENYYEIKKKVNEIYYKLLVISFGLFFLLSYFEYNIVWSANCDSRLFAYTILSSVVADVIAFTLTPIILVLRCRLCSKELASGSVIGVFLHVLCYVGIMIYIIYGKRCTLNVWMIIMGVVLSAIMLIVTLIPSWFCYKNIVTLQLLCLRSKQVINFFVDFQSDIDTYNFKISEYNNINLRIEKVGETVSKKYKYKKIRNIQKKVDIPVYSVSNIHMLYCINADDYLKDADKYIKKGSKKQNGIEIKITYIDAVIAKKQQLLIETERNAERIENSQNTEKMKDIFKDTTIPAFKALSKRTLVEKKIKSIGRRQ